MQDPFRSIAMSVVGTGFLGLAWAKRLIFGYATPNLVLPSNDEGRIRYVLDTFETWQRFLPCGFDLRGKDVLAVGPGSSRGAGALFLAAGARSYHAIDAFGLAETGDADFHPEPVARRRAARGEAEPVEPIVGQTAVARDGCVASHVIDLQTRSRWVRDRDPNSIDRFTESFYRLFAFPGQPNRKRPTDYIAEVVANGWRDVHFTSVRTIASDRIGAATDGRARAFRKDDSDMTVLNGVLRARVP